MSPVPQSASGPARALPGFADVVAARERIAKVATLTPLLPAPLLDEASGGRVFIKAEVLQRTGSFKFRGAYNRLSLIPLTGRAAGVVACSSGNHAQGVAEAARLLGMPATIVMPSDAPAIKKARTARSGARIVEYDRATQDREAIAREICAASGAVFVHPYDDPGVIAGQGTCGLEIVDQLAAIGLTPDVVLVPASGGGLSAGVGLALSGTLAGRRVITVEPEGFDDHARSFASGERQANATVAGSICDALMATTPGVLTFELNVRQAAGGVTVSDREALSAVAWAFEELKLVAEPGGATALAAVLSGRVDLAGKTAVVVLSGGNIDAAMFARALEGAGGR